MPLFEVADEPQRALAPFWNQRMSVCAVVSCYGGTPDGRLTLAVEQVYHGRDLVADHLWLPCCGELRDLHLQCGEWFQFEGRVYRYVKKRHPCLFSYSIDDICSPKRLFPSEINYA